jgi:orotidine-5'-phosphate decarboxylase
VRRDAKDQLIVALDTSSEEEAQVLLDQLKGVVRWIKVGSVLFTSAGAPFVRRLVKEGWQVFLDLKVHDVPHQVGLTLRAIADLGVGLTTVHTSGGLEMMQVAARAAEGTDLKVVGVTVLTSLNAALLAQTGLDVPLETLVKMRASLANEAGLAGVVASPLEAGMIRDCFPAPFEIVTPGIRPATVDVHDQKRVATPGHAVASGASRLVVGRAITTHANPAAAAQAILDEIR